ncbi:MAG TPA: hypothetical protein VFB50_17465 [Chloroflexota bacterium]|nr:hypothetical protein [Chloroflexota bacterium]
MGTAAAMTGLGLLAQAMSLHDATGMVIMGGLVLGFAIGCWTAPGKAPQVPDHTGYVAPSVPRTLKYRGWSPKSPKSAKPLN